jgi:hypothetical protein
MVRRVSRVVKYWDEQIGREFLLAGKMYSYSLGAPESPSNELKAAWGEAFSDAQDIRRKFTW